MSDLGSISSVVQNKPSRLYLPQLDTLRLFSFVSVFFFHGLPSNDVNAHRGWAQGVALIEATIHRSLENGVGMFFLLSAFLITELLRREKKATGSIHLVHFYLRRALRIWPLYYLILMLGLLLSAVSPRFLLAHLDMWSYSFFWKNWYLAFHGPSWNPIYILWTVSAEEQFYAVWPVLQKWCSKRTLLILCALLIVIIPWFAYRPSGHFYKNGVSQIPYLFMYFPSGAVLAYLLKGRISTRNVWYCSSLVIAGVLLWLAGTFLSYPGDRAALTFGLFLAGRAAVFIGTISIFLGFLWSNPLWSAGPLVYGGRISYGLYVFHVMALLLAARIIGHFGLLAGVHSFRLLAIGLTLKFAIAAALTLVTATLSYEYFERRFLALKDRLSFISSRPQQPS